ncbi:MAG: twin-arginine translocase TatA/TatE family subunit [Mariprofundaceae bacterium]|nr:twin-arginine translocase TatA/TatE family subunit [Mariprofundaceae bacterium]
MPDIGLVELLLIGLVLFLVVGPERLPEVMVQVADIFRTLRQWSEKLRTVVTEQTEAFKKPLEQECDPLRQDMYDSTTPITTEFNDLIKQGKVTLDEQPKSNSEQTPRD